MTSLAAIRTSRVLVSFSLGMLLGAPASGQQPAGSIKALTGSAFVIRGGQEIGAAVGQPLFEGDRLRTAADGRLGLTLKDGTRVSLGGSTDLELNAFAFSPADGRLALAMRVLRGVAAYISGRIADLSPGSVKIETPTSVIGVRGTHILIGVDQP